MLIKIYREWQLHAGKKGKVTKWKSGGNRDDQRVSSQELLGNMVRYAASEFLASWSSSLVEVAS